MRKRGKEVSLNFKVSFSPFSFNLLVKNTGPRALRRKEIKRNSNNPFHLLSPFNLLVNFLI